MKITELVKTYKLLNDPNAPDWNIKFIGGAILALGIIAATGVALYNLRADQIAQTVPAAATLGEDTPTCTPEQEAEGLLAYKVEHPSATELPVGTLLPPGCVVR